MGPEPLVDAFHGSIEAVYEQDRRRDVLGQMPQMLESLAKLVMGVELGQAMSADPSSVSNLDRAQEPHPLSAPRRRSDD